MGKRLSELDFSWPRIVARGYRPVCDSLLLGSVIGGAFFLIASVAATAAPPVLKFTDVTRAAGIDFEHTIGDDKMTNIVESTGAGVALFDYDRDGWLDIYLVSGVYRDGVSDPNISDKARLQRATDRLYRNRGDWTFEDVTQKVGILPGGYGMGVTVGDIDNDGYCDLFVTNYGPNRLYHNLGGQKFEEIAGRAGIADDHFGVGCAFFDLDGDTLLDLYVGNYLDYVSDFDKPDGFPGPSAYKEQLNRLYRNRGNCQFSDITEQAGLSDQHGHTMGVGVVDFNEDGHWDLFVANDAMENYYFENTGDGKFEENALLTNIAYGANGDARGAMGAEVGDVDGDGKLDLFVPDFTNTCLYMNLGDGFFEDRSQQAGIAILCGHYVSWGAALVDLDRDADLDLYIANGDARKLLAHNDLVFLNNGRGEFREVSKTCGVAALEKRVSRGVAAGDLDNDGDLDLVVLNLNAPPTVLRNEIDHQTYHWLMIELTGREGKSNRDAIGAMVRCEVVDSNGSHKVLIRQRSASGSYMCAHDPRLHFGLGNARQVDRLVIRWPDGSEQIMREVEVDQVLKIAQP